MSSPAPPERNIVIIGGGIIGCTTAYYLATHPAFDARTTTITLLEASAHGAAQGASGKAGGLVAKWAYPAELVDVSFAEHVRLAEAHDGAARWGWRFVNCGSWEGRGEPAHTPSAGGAGARRSLEKTRGLPAGKTRADRGLPDDLDWVREDLTAAYAPMAPPGDTAQVHPYLFTTSMLALAQDRGVRFVRGRAGAVHVAAGAVTGVAYTAEDASEHTLPASHVVVAAGAWSPALVQGLPVSGTRAHSITVRPPAGTRVAPYVLFTEIALGRRGARASPEIYARPDGEVYCCGPGDDAPVPATVDDVPVDAGACESIHEHVASISPQLAAGTVERRQACFLPVARGGGPIVGEARSVAKGLVIATGHTCWGICNAPGTAKAIAELILDGKITCANLKALDPSRYL
ncbi:FAD dependent oxidoreductase [Phanerochaete sordida]|uniref:FAD dependent oxidoreductase n=1 Tax=Phanerochaete sordida TaxID=48140 RepID=A0A9P3GFM4_9APHY|nr:FAD dependent oxidoreductase [Phanerochaete sordida]